MNVQTAYFVTSARGSEGASCIAAATSSSSSGKSDDT